METLLETGHGNTSAAPYQSPVESHVPYWDLATRVVFALLIGLVMAVAIIGNIMVILVIGNNTGMRTRTNILLCNLAVADLACAIFDMPISMVTIATGGWIFNDVVCQLNGFSTTVFLTASIHTLMYMSIHKYISIKRPFSRGLRKRWVYAMIGCSWLWSVSAGFVSLYGLSSISYKPYTAQCGPVYPDSVRTYLHFGLLRATSFYIPLGVMLFCYANVFCEMRTHSRRMAKNTTLERDAILSQQKRITCTLFLVLVMFVVCWLPNNIYAMYVALIVDKTRTPSKFNPFSYLFGYTNSAVNPVLYALRSPAFRQGYKQVVCLSSRQRYSHREWQMYSLSRTKSSFRHYFQIGIPTGLKEAEGRRFPSARKSSLGNLVNVILFPRSRTLSTSSLPHQLSTNHFTGRTPQTDLYIAKWLESLRNTNNKPKAIGPKKEVALDGEGQRYGNTCGKRHVAAENVDVINWEDELTEVRVPTAYAAQVSVTSCVLYDVATPGSVECEISAPPTEAVWSESAEVSRVGARDRLTVAQDARSPGASASSLRNLLHNLIRKVSSKSSSPAKSHVRDDADGALTVQSRARYPLNRSSTASYLERMESANDTNQSKSGTMQQSKSEPFLDDNKYHNRKPRKTAKTEQDNKTRRYPSVEKLDYEPQAPLSGNTAKRTEMCERKVSHFSKKRRTRGHNFSRNKHAEMSWFLRENKHGKVARQHRTKKERTYSCASSSYLNRSLSDPCLTFKTIQERIVATRDRKTTARKRGRRVESRSSDEPRVEFVVGEASEGQSAADCNDGFKCEAVFVPDNRLSVY